MERTKGLMTLAAGVGVGIALVLSCGDDSPGDADAAVCDCPAAEAPLAGRVQEFEETAEIAVQTSRAIGVDCPSDAIPLGGSCLLDELAAERVNLTMAYQGSQTWVCRWDNLSPEPRMGIVRVRCLMPAQ
ncbi:MAG: hypothetical protein H6708_20640 [Kofleriaceae bacterium]|nr:hypothetical protein [Myxococcales bacterium]MCB9562817.1 hypothetical protein [Kofleriaceae bacterium]